jgi:hypothetical protein
MEVAAALKLHYIFTTLQHISSQVMVMVILYENQMSQTQIVVIFMLLTVEDFEFVASPLSTVLISHIGFYLPV